MSTQSTLGRACKGCNSLKIRCEPSSTDANTCERCLRTGKECVSAGKRRRPRDRIAELEAQVAQLSKALQSQKLSHRSPATSTDEKVSPSTTAQLSTVSDPVAFLDTHVHISTQQKALELYIQDVSPTFSIVPLELLNLENLRSGCPVLLIALVTFSTPYILPMHTQNALLEEAMRIFAVEVILRPNRRLEVVLAFLVAAYWFRTLRGATHVTLHQLSQLATSMAIDIGVGGQLAATPGAGSSTRHDPGSIIAQRTWLACFLITSRLSITIRRPDVNAQWTPHHEKCLTELSSFSSMTPSERLFIHLARYERLCYYISTSIYLCDSEYIWDLADNQWEDATLKLRKDIDRLTAEVPSDIDRRPISFYRYFAIMCLNEPVLHTVSNKLSFAAPARVETIVESDFAAPVVTGSHVTALYALRDSCHALLDLAGSNATPFLAVCPLVFVGTVSHALFILVKLYISVTGLNNTYGSVLSPAELRLEHYLGLVQGMATSVATRNPESFNARMLLSLAALKNWFEGYVEINSCSSTSNLDLSRLAPHHQAANITGYTSNLHQSYPETESEVRLDPENYNTWLLDLFHGDLPQN